MKGKNAFYAAIAALGLLCVSPNAFAKSRPTVLELAIAVHAARASQATIRQAGQSNSSGASQNGDGNDLSIAQTGSQQQAIIRQAGDDNRAGIRQVGKNNDAAITQSGDGNAACIIQVGKNLNSGITQIGDGQSAGVLQTRHGTYDIPAGACDAGPFPRFPGMKGNSPKMRALEAARNLRR